MGSDVINAKANEDTCLHPRSRKEEIHQSLVWTFPLVFVWKKETSGFLMSEAFSSYPVYRLPIFGQIVEITLIQYSSNSQTF